MAGYATAAAQLKQFWGSRNSLQKGLLIGGALAAGVLVGLFAHLLGTPDYKPLSTGLDPADAQALAAKLDQEGIPHQISADGKTINVAADKLDQARMEAASDQDLHSGRLGFELFDKSSWGQTEFDEKVTYQRALEGELARSIQTLANVESARVHLVMPADSIFLDQQQGAKASVILKLRSGTLSKEEALAISRLAAGAVNELKPEDVAIVDADSGRSLTVANDNGASGESDLTARLISTLEPVAGAGRIRASVNVDYNQGTIDESEEKYDPAVHAVLSDQKSEDQAGGTAGESGVPGAVSNIPSAAKSKPASVLPTQHSVTENAQYGVNKTVLHTVTPAGRIQRITAAILVDDEFVRTVENGKSHTTRRKRSQQELNQIKELAAAVIGFDEKRGDIITVENIPFDSDSADLDVGASTWHEQVRSAVSESSPVLRPLSILALFLLAYLFVIRPVQKQALQTAPAVAAVTQPQLTAERRESLAVAAAEPSSMRAAQLKEKALEMLRQDPLQTTRSVQKWLREENS